LYYCLAATTSLEPLGNTLECTRSEVGRKVDGVLDKASHTLGRADGDLACRIDSRLANVGSSSDRGTRYANCTLARALHHAGRTTARVLHQAECRIDRTLRDTENFASYARALSLLGHFYTKDTDFLHRLLYS
jgi:hypothetical protein